jgi:hypothetical protein
MKYLTKGDLLTILSDEASAFTAFMMDPTQFGVTEPLLTTLKLEKQKFDWTNGIDVGLPQVQSLLAVLQGYGVISAEKAEAVNAIPDTPELDSFTVNILAQDDITESNRYGAEMRGSSYYTKVDFVNTTKNELITEEFIFDRVPSKEEMNAAIMQHIKHLKAR